MITLPAKTTPEAINDRLHDLTDGTFEVIAVEVYDHPEAREVSDGAAFGGDGGPTTLGAWLLGRPAEVHAYIAERGYQRYEEQYAEGYEED